MKNLLPLIFLLTAYCSSAQNYNCLQRGVKPFYTNGNGYLRGMRIDSVTVSGSDTIFHPYHTPRVVALNGNYFIDPLDSVGGSWLGKNVIKHTNGTFRFDDEWYDSIVIKTQAHLGDTWTFFKDTTNISYKATLTAIDTMTILGIIDSVKKITIEADVSGVMNTADPVNNFQIILSKNHGFVQVFDLYTFPYHVQGNYGMAIRGVDYYLDLVLNNLICNCDMGMPNYVTTVNSIFKLVPFHNPTLMELYNFSVGEVLEFDDQNTEYSGNYTSDQITLDTVLSKTYTATSVNYTFAERGRYTVTTYPPPATTTSYSYGLASRSYDTTLLIDTTLMPEEWNQPNFYHFFPKANYDSGSVCPDTVCIVDVNNIAYPSGVVIFETETMVAGGSSFIGNSTNTYSIGLGLSIISFNNYTASTSGGPAYSETGNYVYDNNHGHTCGGYESILPVSVPQINAITNDIIIFPNPATTQLTIQSNNHPIIQLSITNLLGQTIYTQQPNITKTQVDISALQPGIYFVKINGTDVRKFVKE